MEKKILVVDDQITNHYILRSLIEDNSFGLSKHIKTFMDSAFSGRECLTYLEENSVMPDLIILDLDMPYMTGLQLIQKIRQEEKFKNIKIIALTGNVGKDIKKKCSDAGFNDFISKPYNGIQMIKYLENIISK